MRGLPFVLFAALVTFATSEAMGQVQGRYRSDVQTSVVRTTGGVDTTGWILIAVLHGADAALVQEGQQVRAFSVNSRTRMHLARVTRVTRQQSGVRLEATLAARVLGTSTRYLMEISVESI